MSNPPAKDPSNASIILPRDLDRDRRLAESEQSGDQVEDMEGEDVIELNLPKKQPRTAGGDNDKAVDLSEVPEGVQPVAATDEDPADPSDVIIATKPADNQMRTSDGRPICVVAPMPRIPEPAEPVSGAYEDDDAALDAVVPRTSSPNNNSARHHHMLTAQ